MNESTKQRENITIPRDSFKDEPRIAFNRIFFSMIAVTNDEKSGFRGVTGPGIHSIGAHK